MTKKDPDNFINWTLKRWREVPFLQRTSYFAPLYTQSLVIVPGLSGKKHCHDSGYRCMSFVFRPEDPKNVFREYKKGEKYQPWVQVGGSADVLNLDFIASRLMKMEGGVTAAGGISIDCLPASGLLHLFCNSYGTHQSRIKFNAWGSSTNIALVTKETDSPYLGN